MSLHDQKVKGAQTGPAKPKGREHVTEYINPGTRSLRCEMAVESSSSKYRLFMIQNALKTRAANSRVGNASCGTSIFFPKRSIVCSVKMGGANGIARMSFRMSISGWTDKQL